MAWLCVKGGKKAGDVAMCIQWPSLGARHSAGPVESEHTEASGAEGDDEQRSLGFVAGAGSRLGQVESFLSSASEGPAEALVTHLSGQGLWGNPKPLYNPRCWALVLGQRHMCVLTRCLQCPAQRLTHDHSENVKWVHVSGRPASLLIFSDMQT